jgi:hypothetical protein
LHESTCPTQQFARKLSCRPELVWVKPATYRVEIFRHWALVGYQQKRTVSSVSHCSIMLPP